MIHEKNTTKVHVPICEIRIKLNYSVAPESIYTRIHVLIIWMGCTGMGRWYVRLLKAALSTDVQVTFGTTVHCTWVIVHAVPHILNLA